MHRVFALGILYQQHSNDGDRHEIENADGVADGGSRSLVCLRGARRHGARFTSPTLVQAGLKRFAHDDADVVRHAEAKAYERLAKEEDDFAKDAELLRAAIRDQPEAFRDAVEARIQQVLAASHKVTLAGMTHVDADVHSAVDALAEAVRKLNAEFPEALRSPV